MVIHKTTVKDKPNVLNAVEIIIRRKARNQEKKHANVPTVENTANWKGCKVYKNKVASLQKTRTTVTQRVQQRIGTPSKTQYATTSKTYIDAVKRNLEQLLSEQEILPTVDKEPTIQDIWNLLNNMQPMLMDTRLRLDVLEESIKHKSQNTVNRKKQNKSRTKNDRYITPYCRMECQWVSKT